MSLLSKLFNFVIMITNRYKIDESHGLSHSMDVLINAHNIYESELIKNNYLKDQQFVIYISAILHDMCDKKYMNETEGIENISLFLNKKMPKNEIDITKKIITTMSYSKVKINGFPKMDDYQLAYHIVREADLLSAYNFDRCMIYNMNKMNGDILGAYVNAQDLFENRVFKHDYDGLLITDYSKKLHQTLKLNAEQRINSWSKIITNKKLLSLHRR